MKYLIPLFLVSLVGCHSTPSSKTFVCINPFMAIQGVQIYTADPAVKETRSTLEVTTQPGTVIVVPKTICAEVRRGN